MTCGHLCQNAQDRIFGIVGIIKKVTNAERLFSELSYSNDASYVFTKFTRELLAEINWLGFCCNFSNLVPDQPLNLPSWVPQYEVGQKSLSMIGMTDKAFNAPGMHLSTDSHPAPGLNFLNDQLGFPGCRIGLVKATSECLAGFADKGDTAFEAGIQLILDILGMNATSSHEVIEAFWKCLVADQFAGCAEEMLDSFASWWLKTWVALTIKHASKGIDEYFRTIPNVERLSHAITSIKFAGHETIKATIGRVNDSLVQSCGPYDLQNELLDERTPIVQHSRRSLG